MCLSPARISPRAMYPSPIIRRLRHSILEYFRDMSCSLGVENDVTASVLGRCPEVFTMEEEPVDEKEIWELLERCLRNAMPTVRVLQTEGGRGTGPGSWPKSWTA